MSEATRAHGQQRSFPRGIAQAGTEARACLVALGREGVPWGVGDGDDYA